MSPDQPPAVLPPVGDSLSRAACERCRRQTVRQICLYLSLKEPSLRTSNSLSGRKLRCSRERPTCARCSRFSITCTYPRPADRKPLATRHRVVRAEQNHPTPGVSHTVPSRPSIQDLRGPVLYPYRMITRVSLRDPRWCTHVHCLIQVVLDPNPGFLVLL